MISSFPVEINIENTKGIFTDGWLESSAFLEFISDESLTLDFFLPRVQDASEAKTISIYFKGEKTELFIERGKVVRWGPIDPKDGRLSIQVISDEAEPPKGEDERVLGIFLARVWCGYEQDSLRLSDLISMSSPDAVSTDAAVTASGSGHSEDDESEPALAPPKPAEAHALPPAAAAHNAPSLSTFERAAMEQLFDRAFYIEGLPKSNAPDDALLHYWTIGRFEGREPAPWFSSHHYLAMHPDVAAAGMNPFLHYAIAGKAEGRALARLGAKVRADVFKAHEFAVAPGPHFEEADATIGVGRARRAKVLAYYLPQFHPTDVNDEQWGKGFTEWRNLPRALPRFSGHVQPRIPRDLGPYRLDEGDAIQRQVELAKAAGLHGFCFYHYWFDGRRVLDAPMERILADASIDFPFCLMWANENWTRTWDGAETEIILQQSYDPSDDEAFVEDIARHMSDNRYIKVSGRPLFFIYRPGHIPKAKETIGRWRTIFASVHGLEPLIFMAQGFGDLDPRAYGLDGAIEFPPHKVCQDLPPINAKLDMFHDDYSGHVVDYDAMVTKSLTERAPEFPLIKTATPTWDNESRRPGRGLVIQGSTPAKFERWMTDLVRYASVNPVFGETFVCVNAWNEWAEGAVLEPDVHHGGAYLNAVSRAVHGVAGAMNARPGKLLIVGHDAAINGAQTLALNLGRCLSTTYGIEVAYLLGKGGPLLPDYEKIGRVHVSDAKFSNAEEFLFGLRDDGFRDALTNTTPAGRALPVLKSLGFSTISLVHELPNTLKSYGFQDAAHSVAEQSDRVIFPAEVVRAGFEAFGGPVQNQSEIFPQGLYNTAVLDLPHGDHGLRAELGLAKDSRIVLGVGYADMRKGIDRFVACGLSLCAHDPKAVFLWVGAPSREVKDWLEPEVAAAGLSDRVRILGHRADVARFFQAADAFYLSSREDPFPSVVLEALAAGLPVVGHEGCGGCDDLVRRHGTLVASSDPLAALEAIDGHLRRTLRKTDKAAAARRAEVAQNYDFDAYVFGLLSRFDPDLVPVSAVIPNYNYEAHIGERLHTVFDQTYPLREVVVLDDASPDASVAVIRATAEAARRRIDLHVNDTNSGSPVPQWRRGVELARGDYVWIAEADDLATPDFVARLVARMRAAGSVLGFCDSRQMDEADRPLGASYKPYINEGEPGAFDTAFDMDGAEFLARHLSVKNVILNVSGAIFRRDALLDAFAAVGEELYDYKVAGDWRLYVELCARGGRVSYLPEVMNAHRRHSTSVTHALKVEKHLAEIAQMHEIVRGRVALGDAVRHAQTKNYAAAEAHLGKAR